MPVEVSKAASSNGVKASIKPAQEEQAVPSPKVSVAVAAATTPVAAKASDISSVSNQSSQLPAQPEKPILKPGEIYIDEDGNVQQG